MELRPKLKSIMKDLLYMSGMSKSVLVALGLSGKPKWFIFTYHRICDSAEKRPYMAVPLKVFEKHMRFIKNNFKTVNMADGLKLIKESGMKGLFATINFDDGYIDNYLYAYPILKKYNMPATIFLATALIGKRHAFWWDRVFNIIGSSEMSSINFKLGDGFFDFNLGRAQQREDAVDCINGILKKMHEVKIEDFIKGIEKRYGFKADISASQMLGWNEIKEMSRNGISFGAHTHTHRNLCFLDKVEMRDEILGSKKHIEDVLGLEINEFSYPYGIFNEEVRKCVEEVGFKCARGSARGFNQEHTDRFSLNSMSATSVLSKNSLIARLCVSSIKQVLL